MRLTVHQVEVSLWMPGNDLAAHWFEYGWEPSAPSHIRRESGAVIVRDQSRPIAVVTPPLCRLEDIDLPVNPNFRPELHIPPARRRLVTPFDKWGWDPTSVVNAAERGQRGFRLATAGEAEKQASPAIAPPKAPETAIPPSGIAAVPTDHLPSPLHISVSLASMGLPYPVFDALRKGGVDTPEQLAAWVNSGSPPVGPLMAGWGSGFLAWAASLVREALTGPDTTQPRLHEAIGLPTPKWGIRFAPHSRPDDQTFLTAASLAPNARLATTKDLSAVATWPDATHAAGWMRGAGLEPSVPVPIGVGYIYPSVAEIPTELVGYGVQFELSDSTTARLRRDSPEPTPAPKSTPKQRRSPIATAQALFTFED